MFLCEAEHLSNHNVQRFRILNGQKRIPLWCLLKLSAALLLPSISGWNHSLPSYFTRSSILIKTSTLKLCCFLKTIAPLLCESNMLHQWSYPKQCVLGRCLPSHYRLEMSLPSSDTWGPVNETLKCRNRFVSLQFPAENAQNHRRISTRSSNTFISTKSSWYFPINVPFFWREI